MSAGQPCGFFASIWLYPLRSPSQASRLPRCTLRRRSISFPVFSCSVVNDICFRICLPQSSFSRPLRLTGRPRLIPPLNNVPDVALNSSPDRPTDRHAGRRPRPLDGLVDWLSLGAPGWDSTTTVSEEERCSGRDARIYCSPS